MHANFMAVLLGNGGYAATQWGVLVVLARLAGVESVGVYAFASAVVMPLYSGLSLQLRAVQVSDQRERHPFTRYLALRLTASFVLVLAACVWALAASPTPSAGAVVVLLAAAKAVDGIADIFYGAWQRRERMVLASAALFANGALTVALASAMLMVTHSVVWACAGSLMASALVAGTVAYFGRGEVTNAPSWRVTVGRDLRAVAQLAYEAAPLGIVLLLVALQANAPRYFVGAVLGDRALGVFAAVSQLTTAGAMVVSSLGAAASPRLARAFTNGDIAGFRALAGRLALVGVALGVAGLVLTLTVGRQLLRLLYGGEFEGGFSLLVWLSVGSGLGFAAAFIGFALTSARRIRSQPILFVVVIGAVSLGCLGWIPVMGLDGAGAAVSLGWLVQAVLSWSLLRGAFRAAPSPREATSQVTLP